MDVVISSTELREKNPIEVPRTTDQFSRYSFWHYTKMSTIEKILNSGSFQVGSIADMNDFEERDRHWKKRGNVNALCFCNSNTEKIPMWYLYSGIDGKGAALGLTPGSMIHFLSSIQTAQVLEGKEQGRLLERGKEFDVQFGWVFYRDIRDHKRIFYRNKWYAVDDEKSFEKDNFFIKQYPWEYEREFRIVFLSKTDAPVKKLEVEIPEQVRRKMKLWLAPGINDASVESEIAKYHSIRDQLYSRTEKSMLKVNINLMDRNREAIREMCLKEAASREEKETP